jgi:lipoprotein-anchoring transpeptidase ErfK/SrfK
MRRSWRAGISGAVVASMGALLLPAQAVAVESELTPPSIVSVTPGASASVLNVVYSAKVPGLAPNSSAPIINQISVDTVNWYTCPALPVAQSPLAGSFISGACPLSELTPLRTYGVYMRSTQALASSVVVGPIVATTQPPLGTDPAKPTKLPKKRTWVSAKFIAASNSLGVDGSKVRVGVGVLPKIVFTSRISDKKIVEQNLIVSAQLPSGKLIPVEGAWGWINDTSAVFRPKNYWPGKSTIRVASLLGRTILGTSGSKSLIGLAKLNTTYSFQTARKFIAKVDGKTRKMKVFVDGVKVKTFKVSLGKDEWETRNGPKIISTAKEAEKTYRSESLGLTDPADQYELDARWNTRLTPTGEFIHAAPWAYGRLGVYNGSHGCTNMFEQDARWIFDQTIPGDVVLFTNTGGSLVEPWNGPGGLWNIPWNKWLKKSALYSGSANVDTNTNAGTGSLADAKPASA